MNINDLFPSKYLKAADIGDQEFHVTIDRLALEQVRNQKGQFEEKPVLYFQGAHKGLILSGPNAHTIGALYGPETGQWPGKRITLYVAFGERHFGKTFNVVRVRPTPPPDSSAPAAATASSPKSPVPMADDETEEEIAPGTVSPDAQDLRQRMEAARQKFQDDFGDVGLKLFDEFLVHLEAPHISLITDAELPQAITEALQLHKTCQERGVDLAGQHSRLRWYIERLEQEVILEGSKRLRLRRRLAGDPILIQCEHYGLEKYRDYLERKAKVAVPLN